MPSTIPDGRLLGLDSQAIIQIIVHLFNLGLLAFLMARFLYRPVRDFLRERTTRIGQQLVYAKREKAEAEQLRASYEQKLRELEQEKSRMLSEAQDDAYRQCEHMLAEARSEAEDLIANAREEIAREKKLVRSDMQQVIIELSSSMAEKFVEISMDDDGRRRLFEQTIAQLQEVPWWG